MGGQTVYHQFDVLCYNVVYTSLPVLALGIFEQDVSDEMSVSYPGLYSPGLWHQLWNPRRLAEAALSGVLTSLLVLFIPLGWKE